MRDVRTWVLVGVVVALAILVVGTTQHVRAIRSSLRESETRRVRAGLQVHANKVAAELDHELSTQPRRAIYSLDGDLIYPAPPALARPWEPPHATLSALFLRQGAFERAWEAAASSADRAAVLVARGMHGKDSKDLRAALDEPALKGTDLYYRVGLEIVRLDKLQMDDWWFETYMDSLFALIGGPSEELAHALVKEATGPHERVLSSRARRRELATLNPHEDARVRGGWIERFQRVDDAWQLKRSALDEYDLLEGHGEIAEPLPAPFSNLVVRADVDEDALDAAVQRETRLVVALYGLAGLLLIVGTVYSVKATGRALRLAQDQSDFVANVTHELKTPLANVHLYAESLRQGRVKPEDRDAFLDTILEESRRLDGLVEGLLHAARGAKITRARVDTRELVEQAAARWRPRLEEEGFEFTVEPGPSVEVSADAEALQRALDNLLDNARKYSREDRRIHLSGSCNDGLARLTVRDHGPGIPVQDRKRVLEPFTRLESADRKATPGTGLGLSLAAACMKAHGGRVEISENSGAGSAVSLVLVLEAVR